ncbi:hypothetical protein I3760_08G003800 [Carya illinoinensis]|nr:hypothetical protein I3760_08G003800 [Carya illinoinensis]
MEDPSMNTCNKEVKKGTTAKSGNKNAKLLRLVEERALSMEKKKKQHGSLVPFVPQDCISNILVRLPLDSLQKSRKLTALPLGTLFSPHNESYGIALNSATGEYKVIHLFRDELGFIGCEILILGTKLWRGANGPSFGHVSWFGYMPVSAIGALHWIPHVDRSDYIVSMDVNEEKFHTTPLPKSCRTHDRVVEMGGFLSFVTHEGVKQIDIWVLKGLSESWTKQYCITKGCKMDMVPLFSLRIKGDMIFKRDKDGSLYAYDFQSQVMAKVEMEKGCFPLSCLFLPHVNSLVSWSNRERGQDA